MAATLSIAVVLGVTLGLATVQANRAADASIRRELADVRRGVHALLAGRAATLAGMGRVTAQVPELRERLLKSDDHAAVLDQAQRCRELLGAAWVLVTNEHGILVARTDYPEEVDVDLSRGALVAGALSGESSSGAWLDDRLHGLFMAVGVPLGAGALVAAYAIDDSLAREIERATTTDVVLFALDTLDRPSVVGSTLPREAVGPALAADTAALRRLVGDSSDVEVSAVVGDEHLIGLASPIRSAGGDAFGGVIVFRSRERELAAFAWLRRTLAVAFALAVGLAVVSGLLFFPSHYRTTGSDSQIVGYVASRRLATQSHMRKEPVMSKLRYVGLDVHAETIAVAVAEPTGEVRSVGEIPNQADSIRRLVKKLGGPDELRACYEAGPTGYVLYWQLTALGVACEVVAPTLVPVKAGDRVKTDRRDAVKLARSYRAGDLTAVWVPEPAHEALRDLVRAREAAKQDQLRARHRLGKFLLRQGRRPPETMKAWTQAYLHWVRTAVQFPEPAQEATLLDYLQEVDHAAARLARLEQALDQAVARAPAPLRAVIAAVQALRGVAQVSAATVACEVGTFARFQTARQFMGYVGLVAREASSGTRTWRGGITKTGNAHVRRIVGEVAWAYRHRPAVGAALKRRQVGVSAAVKEIAWKAQHRLHARYRHLLGRGKRKQQAVTAVARELLGFIWAIGVTVEQELLGASERRAA